ncbi:MAG: hypothetical protein WBA63_04925 [Thermomicrobiales bacterium]
MALSPDDMPVPGFGLESSNRYLVDTFPDETAEFTRDGFLRGYESQLGLAASGANDLDMRVQTLLDLYTDVAGAQRGFDYFAGRGGATTITLTGTHTIGEQSTLLADQRTDPAAGELYVSQVLVFQSGPIGATVYVQWFKDDPEGVSFIESLGDRLLAKIGAGAGPRLGARLTRVQLDDDMRLTSFDGYVRLAGRDFRFWDDTPAQASGRASKYPGATDAYAIVQTVADQPDAAVVFLNAAESPVRLHVRPRLFPMRSPRCDRRATIAPEPIVDFSAVPTGIPCIMTEARR